MPDDRPPLPPSIPETAIARIRGAEDGWNSRDPVRVSLAYSEDSRWRNRSEFLTGRPAIVAFLAAKWARELEYRLIKELWACWAAQGEPSLACRLALQAAALARGQQDAHPPDSAGCHAPAAL